MIHRDLKPANIWLAEDGSAKLGDFGIAQAIDRSRLTMPGTMMGTAAYMAPEQAQGREVTARSDLYSLGCVLYELLTGRPPFDADDPLTVVSQHIHAQPAPPRRVRRRVAGSAGAPGATAAGERAGGPPGVRGGGAGGVG